jgi:dihydrofolate reductase
VAKLIYSAIASLDGYVADENGNFDWAAPDEEVHRFVNHMERPIGRYLLGRRMYEVMRFWDSPQATADQPDVMIEFASIWRAADKIVFSRSLAVVSTGRTHLEREFDAASVRQLKATDQRDLSIGGPELAANALRTGLVDEIQLYLTPVVVGGGKRALPDGMRLDLRLLDERRFRSGVVYLRYRITLDS